MIGCSMQQKTQNSNRVAKWTAPAIGNYKMNSDDTVAADGSVGLGVVLRNDKEKIMLAAMKGFKASWDVDLAEIHAIKFGLEVSRDTSFHNFDLE
ncbi:hypothetical protein GH714_019557 [Hevea brasiliensis]|uniref:RNase H type-1 domain-containing protein n=1 Tax=Hevea brasiliensis TaxID=3981 RepID=A0A6A6L9Y1_HEVBR|nr:hypothetical protein GH714_019557 [Hevea brasiliensis]